MSKVHIRLQCDRRYLPLNLGIISPKARQKNAYSRFS